MKLKKEHIEILRHTLGDETMYRNHYGIYDVSEGFSLLEELEEGGYMVRRQPNEEIFGDIIFFHATEKGKRVAYE